MTEGQISMSSQGPAVQIGGSAGAASAADLAGLIEGFSQRVDLVRRQLGQVIFGQEQTVEQALIAILSGGHVLLIGVPGLAKTKLVDSLGQVLGVDAQRVQCTPDLMPSDIVGSEVLEESESGRRSFRFIKGPVFCQLLMADEINRASPRTQSALLQAMQERKVSVAGHTYTLPEPFHVLATQNPLDRFLLQIDVDYPSNDAERQMLIVTTGSHEAGLTRVLTPEDVLSIQRLVRRMPVGEKVVDAILKMVRAGRPDTTGIKDVKEGLAWGPGPRAGQALMLATRARALIQGRFSPSIDDVVALAHPVLRHRIALTYGARAEGATPKAIIDRLIAEIA
jgi:MoxR-like ATPase